MAKAACDAVCEAGLDDCSVGGAPNGDVYLFCEREAESLLDAIASVLIDLRKIDLRLAPHQDG